MLRPNPAPCLSIFTQVGLWLLLATFPIVASAATDTNFGADILWWGGNEHYQLGTGKRNNVNSPVYIGPLDGDDARGPLARGGGRGTRSLAAGWPVPEGRRFRIASGWRLMLGWKRGRGSRRRGFLVGWRRCRLVPLIRAGEGEEATGQGKGATAA